MSTENKTIIGRLESINLPQLNIKGLEVRVDTGAKTSSIHADNIVEKTVDEKSYVSFDIHPDIHNVNKLMSCVAPVSDIRKIKSSNGEAEQRYVIKTPVSLGALTWEIEITLTNRADMNYLMLFGREALGEQFLVDASKIFLQSDGESLE